VTRVHVSILIDAPVADVWAAIERIESHVSWMADADAIRFEGEQRQGVGTRFVCDTRIGPLRVADRMEVTAWEPGRLMGVRHQGVVTGTGRFTLTAAGERTHFAWEEDVRFPWYLGGPIGSAIGGPLVLAPLWRRNLRRLQQLIEAAPA
jgi:hypothetical protein